MGKTVLAVIGFALGGVISLRAQPVITVQPADPMVVYGNQATFSVMVTGVGPFVYQWRCNGTNLPNNLVTTLAGGRLEDGLAATNTTLNSPQSTAVDAAGNLFIADANNHVIRKVGADGVAHIIAGVGVGGFAGDGGAATNAFLGTPVSVAVDTNGNIYIADEGVSRIRKVDTNGIIATVAGNGSFPVSGNGSMATNVGLNYPYGVAVDNAGNFYIADSSSYVIREVTASGTMNIVAGSYGSLAGFSGDGSYATTAKLNYPNGVAVDAAGNIFIADTYNQRIRKVTASTGRIATIAGNGSVGYSGDGGGATAATLNYPNAVALDGFGNIYVADTGNYCIRKITNGIISTVAGNGICGSSGDGGYATSASLASPEGIAVDKYGNLYISDANQRVRKVTTDGLITTVAGKNLAEGVSATNAIFNWPAQPAQDAAGNIYVAEIANNRIRKIDANGLVSTFAGNGLSVFAGDGGAATNASISSPIGVATDGVGDVFITDNRHIRKVDTNGIITTFAGKGTTTYSGDGGAATNAGFYPYAIAADVAGNVFIADGSGDRIRKVDTNGIISTVAGNGNYSYSGAGGQATNAGIGIPGSVAVDANGNLFIASLSALRILAVDTNGIIRSVAGTGVFGDSGDGGMATNAQFKSAWGLTVDKIGNLYFSDNGSGRIRKIGTNGIITTIVGNGTLIFPAENVPGPVSGLSNPRGLLMDANGNLVFADQGANRLRRVSYLDFADQPTFGLTNATIFNLSNTYSVVVTSASGSVTSSVVKVNLQLPPVDSSFSVASNTMTLTWTAVSNLVYQLQYATNLTAPVWQNLGCLLSATNTTVQTQDISDGSPQRFYRIQLVQ